MKIKLKLMTFIILVAFIPRFLDLSAFLTQEEFLWLDRSRNFLLALQGDDWGETFQTGDPGVITMWSGSVGLLCYGFTHGLLQNGTFTSFLQALAWDNRPLDLLPYLRLPTGIITSIGIGGIYCLLGGLFRQRVAFVGGLLLALDPMYLAHGRILYHDGLVSTFMTLSALALLLYIRRERAPWALLLSGVCAGLALLSKSLGLFLLPWAALLFLVALFVRRWPLSQVITDGALWALLASLTFFVLWPAMWLNPTNTLWQMRQLATTYAINSHAQGQFFLGQPVADPGWLFYPVVALFAMTPFVMLGLLIAIGSLAVRVVREGKRQLGKRQLGKREGFSGKREGLLGNREGLLGNREGLPLHIEGRPLGEGLRGNREGFSGSREGFSGNPSTSSGHRREGLPLHIIEGHPLGGGLRGKREGLLGKREGLPLHIIEGHPLGGGLRGNGEGFSGNREGFSGNPSTSSGHRREGWPLHIIEGRPLGEGLRGNREGFSGNPSTLRQAQCTASSGHRREGWPLRVGLLLVYVVAYLLFVGFGEKKGANYLLPALVMLNVVAAVGINVVVGQIASAMSKRGFSEAKGVVLATVVLLIGQAITSLPHHPYYLTYYNPLLGGNQAAVRNLLVGWGEGNELAAEYLNQLPDAEKLRVIASKASTFAPYFEGETLFWRPVAKVLEADYVVLYRRDVQKEQPDAQLLRYIRESWPLEKTITLHGLTYAWIYRAPAADWTLPLEDEGDFVGESGLLGYRLNAPAHGQLLVTLYRRHDPLFPKQWIVQVQNNNQEWEAMPINSTSLPQPGAIIEDVYEVKLKQPPRTNKYKVKIGFHEAAQHRVAILGTREK